MTTNTNRPPEHQATLATNALLMGFFEHIATMISGDVTWAAMDVVYHDTEDAVMEVLA